MERGLGSACVRCRKGDIEMIFIYSIFIYSILFGSALRAVPIIAIPKELDSRVQFLRNCYPEFYHWSILGQW